MKALVVATGNRKKGEEIGRMLAGGVEVKTLREYPDAPDVVEDADTFVGNALKKARAIAAHTGLPALADDSGLVVDALNGEPGVYSARYAGEPSNDLNNTALMLKRLEGTPQEKRTARFVCVLAFCLPCGGECFTFEGTVEGRIAEGPSGSNGFGYDPVFVPEGHDRTFAQMSAAEKDSMSHRGRALAKFAAHLKTRPL